MQIRSSLVRLQGWLRGRASSAQVLVNLNDNALRPSRAQDRVDVVVQVSEAHRLLFTITLRGHGYSR